MVVEDSFYASKPVFLTSVEIWLAERRSVKIMQRVSRGLMARKKVAVKEDDVEDDAKAAPKPAVDTAKPDGDVDEIYLSSPPSHLGADVSVRTPGSSSSLRSLGTPAHSPSPRRAA